MTRAIFRNKYNSKKQMLLTRYDSGHYYLAQFIEGPMGRSWVTRGSNGHRKMLRFSKLKTFEILLDYELVNCYTE